jgi:hypothetical protein
MLAFARMLRTPRRVHTVGGVPGRIAVVAGTSAEDKSMGLLLANLAGGEDFLLSFEHLPWKDPPMAEVHVVDGSRALEPVLAQNLTKPELRLKLPPPAVALVSLRPQPPR